MCLLADFTLQEVLGLGAAVLTPLTVSVVTLFRLAIQAKDAQIADKAKQIADKDAFLKSIQETFQTVSASNAQAFAQSILKSEEGNDRRAKQIVEDIIDQAVEKSLAGNNANRQQMLANLTEQINSVKQLLVEDSPEGPRPKRK